MKIEELQSLYGKCAQVKALAKTLGNDKMRRMALSGLSASSVSVVFSALKLQKVFLFIFQDAEGAGYFYHDLTQQLGDSQVLFFPSSYKRAVKYGQKDPANEILRTEVLSRLSSLNTQLSTLNPQPSTLNSQHSTLNTQHSTLNTQPSTLNPQLYIVTYPEALAEMVVARQQFADKSLTLTNGQTVATEQVLKELRVLGFREVDYVYEPGQFALRGSILDVFSYSCEYPFRIDFFGDDIDSVRTFEVENQLSKERCQQATIVPEMSMTQQKASLLTFLPDDAILVFRNYDFTRECIEKTYQEGFSSQALKERLETATEMEARQIAQEMQRDTLLTTGAQFDALAEPFRRIELAAPTLTSPQGEGKREGPREGKLFHISPQPLFHKNFDLLTQTLEDYLLKGYKLFILADSPKQIERLKDILAEKSSLGIEGIDKTLHEGFVDHDLKLCLFTDHQIFDRFHKYNLKSDKARSGKVALTLKEIQQFEIGDYVVHIDHGVGKFGGLVRMPLQDGAFQEMIKIIYQRGDAIYVSIHSLYKVSKYKSQDGGQPPRLSTLGTGQWERLKERTKKHIKDIARDLIRLYATRRHQRGFAFSRDTYMQQELEASFVYEDTPDQLKATQDVKADMEKDTPMDRLVCGDVGFGKTEVAVRAAFKAATDSKQVAVLVPTTVLAYQHYHTFSNRLKDMPVRVDYLTRARTAKQATALLKDLKEGKIDILIGTHKLIGKNVKFKDLGLLIIDEEQKFGVSTKEKLRQMKTNVDTLTMSATPIPRTLQFSLVGARDMSVIQTPPPNRYPIQTEIHTFSADIITEAINFEMSRNGQVFFVNNRINNLRELKEMIVKYIPDCRVAVGHGQMKPDELEQIVLDFSNYDYDVLLSTTIVENGIDIPNANTIIINNAHNFGLSDLHQMRGRVGRGNRKAFCYLLAPPLSALPADSRRRLEALENFSDLGSGINIAMQDLDIRGAGNLLGAEQSGFISDLGYDTYQKILNEAMTELRNEAPLSSPEGDTNIGKPHQKSNEAPSGAVGRAFPSGAVGGAWSFVSDCVLESDLEMYFPDSYVPSDSERILLYRELDNIKDDKELEAYKTRMTDRFGKMPHAAQELLYVVPLRRMGKELGCEKIMLKQGRMFLYFVQNPESPYYQSEAFDHVIDYATHEVLRCKMREMPAPSGQRGMRRSMVIADVPTVEEAVRVLQTIRKPDNHG
ncbi:MAG: transcription-repair coupling factor [Prevotella sp.]|nr:transcription-repair coupling factor [Prevotella sp.]